MRAISEQRKTAALVKAAAKGDKQAFVALVDSFRQTMYATAMAVARNEDDAMDAIQDTILILWEKLDTLRDADAIYREEIARAGLDGEIGQYFAVLTNTRSVGVMGDGRTYDYTLALRAVTTSDFMTADWARIPFEVLDLISTRIVNEVVGINRICYDVTSKPPATIEWE